ncbi:hypothetical protein ES319_D10G072100v1 [Gossypium barbadense]|uniref:Uncharacterized protein n=1 Tax=Gossypium barbadense TaxID=3634 RepID=A0A5J5PMM6_GOSBA|nr:hypothetical protein ES319_D10G072100v1 [Gossypium barbadense]
MSTELRSRKKLKRDVQIWLEDVERIDGEIQSLDGIIGKSSAITRGFRAEDVLKMLKELEEHIQKGKFHEGLVVDNPQWIGQVLSVTALSGEAAQAYIEEIWLYLMDDEVQKIGFCGMGGVGKTSIMKLINNQILKETWNFNSVIWITVSKEMSTAKLQKDIAIKIGVTFSGDEDETTKAGMLFETLSRKSRFLMILDDLWDRIFLDKVGIPEPSAGSKIVLTTRSFDVCRQVGCCRVVKINPLAEEEAWNLFLEKVGRVVLNIPNLEPIAKSIAKHCAGLPLAIITVASCMKGIDDLYKWRNALKELSLYVKSVNGLEDDVFQQLRFSYDRLKDLKLQHCFLSCALYPEDFRIKEEDLIQLWIALWRKWMVGRQNSNNFLLEVVTEMGNERCVKMHDLVRDMALRITTGTPRVLVEAGVRLMEPPNVQEWNKDLEKVSLMENWGLQLPYPLQMSPPKCPILTTFLLSNCRITSIPEGFFKHMHALKILDLSKNPIMSLPISIANLKNLTALLLGECQNLEKEPSLSKLKFLKELDLHATNIKQVPNGMENLSRLKYLNLNHVELDEIPIGIVSNLSLLQNLIIGEMLIRGEELHGLKKLEILKVTFYDLQSFNIYVQSLHYQEEPREYVIHVGKMGCRNAIYSRKYIELCGCDFYINQIMLPPNIEELCIEECYLHCREEDLLFSKLIKVPLPTFASLKFLYIHRCKNIKKLFSANCVPANLQGLWFCFLQLKGLVLKKLPELKSICSADRVVVCDSLDYISVANCLKLKRMPLYLSHLHNFQPSPALSLSVYIEPKEWWESVEWYHPDTKSLLKPFLSLL